VLAAESAKEALDLLDKHPEISLLFTDIVMPDMGGDKLADEAIQRRPNLRVLYTTGFARNAVVHHGVLDAGVNFIAKPFVIEELAEDPQHFDLIKVNAERSSDAYCRIVHGISLVLPRLPLPACVFAPGHVTLLRCAVAFAIAPDAVIHAFAHACSRLPLPACVFAPATGGLST
jgi:CheY-like chemotaxis protein